MYIYKNEILSTMEKDEGFEVIKEYDDGDDAQGGVLVKWKGFAFYISFNDKLALNIKNNSDADDERIYRSTAYDFQITFVMAAKDLKGDSVAKYKIANFANMKTDLGAVYIYREDAGVFEVAVRNTGIVRYKTEDHIRSVVIRMILTGSIAVQELTGIINSYMDAPNAFLDSCKGIS
ncbi:hypothetical protein [Enterobacter sp. A103]|uniref:hypothetical protein n=1 Tax=Enterobacter sp. A103 TaxID=3102785 RepID=UPI002ACA68C1|nr:hypothetical protein [Enterobacter sp. A103]MDZ5638121.1 hypothetical protein [Enterobacter sp. A103]